MQAVSIMRAGGVDAFAEIVECYQVPIIRYLYRLTGDYEMAQDLAQETFIQAYKGILKTNSELRLKAWLYRIATNNVRQYYRRRRIISFIPFDDFQKSGAPKVENQSDNTGEEMAIQEALRKVPAEQRACLVLHYVEGFKYREIAETLLSDPDATYAMTYTYDVSTLEPQVVEPPLRWTVNSVTKHEGIKINRAYIGTCFNSRIDDMRIAAKILKGKKVHPDVRLSVTPGSLEVIKQAAREGLIEIFAEAECEVPMPCCGMCGGFITPLVAGDVCIGTGTCNYPARSGHHDSDIYLANPATVAASALEGKITDPRKYF